jgi:hypothetical protein
MHERFGTSIHSTNHIPRISNASRPCTLQRLYSDWEGHLGAEDGCCCVFFRDQQPVAPWPTVRVKQISRKSRAIARNQASSRRRNVSEYAPCPISFEAKYFLLISMQDNQRRSRARRQEHLADLERRLASCHNTVREAEMQRAAFRDSQIENARLRSLLKVAGVDENLVQSYVNQGISQAQNTDPNHRTIRPRIPVHQDSPRSEKVREVSSTRASPFSENSATFEPESTHPSFHLSSSSFPSNYSSPGQLPLPMEPHMLQGPHMQHLSIFQGASLQSEDSSGYSVSQVPSVSPYWTSSENREDIVP